MSEEQPKFLTALSSFFPVFLLLVVDLFAFWLQPQPNVMSHLALGVLTAQLICLIAFIKGEICNGQRSRLGLANLYFGLFWVVWLLFSLGTSYHNVLMDLVCLCGLAMTIITWKQPFEVKLRHTLLKIAGFPQSSERIYCVVDVGGDCVPGTECDVCVSEFIYSFSTKCGDFYQRICFVTLSLVAFSDGSHVGNPCFQKMGVVL